MRRLAIVLLVAVAVVGLLARPVMAQPPVMGVYGTATVDGEPAPPGTEVVAFIEGQAVARANVTAGGAYNMRIAAPDGSPYSVYRGKWVSFSIRGHAARETVVWQPGENRSLNLTVIMSSPVGPALASIAGKYTVVWGFDAATQTWKLSDPAQPSISDLANLTRGAGYWVNVSEDVTLVSGGNSYALSRGWNLIGWLG